MTIIIYKTVDEIRHDDNHCSLIRYLNELKNTEPEKNSGMNGPRSRASVRFKCSVVFGYYSWQQNLA